MLQAATAGAQPVTNIAAGGYHSLFLKGDGSLWAMGYNGYGELGDGTFNSTNLPERIVASNVTAIAAGQFHSLFIKSDGSLWAMGYNGDGELGDGTYSTNDPYYGTNQPEQIVASNVTAIAAGGYHSLFLKRDGSLWAMGFNNYGELGDGTTDGGNYETNLPEQIVASNVIAIAAGGGSYSESTNTLYTDHSLFLKCDGSLWAMGGNSFGQLGDGTTNDVIQPEEIVASNVTVIAAGELHSLFLKSDGSLWAMGDNGYGELGDSTFNSTNRPEQIVAGNVMAIAAGAFHSLFHKSNGGLWATGNNDHGELGDGTTDYGFYYTSTPENIVAGGVTRISAGYFHSLFLKNDGSLWGMGFNADGELGDGTTGDVLSLEQVLGAYYRISGRPLTGGNVQLSFVGLAGANYALDRATRLSPPNWIPQTTNPAGSFGSLVFTNSPVAATNNFWRIRSVQ